MGHRTQRRLSDSRAQIDRRDDGLSYRIDKLYRAGRSAGARPHRCHGGRPDSPEPVNVVTVDARLTINVNTADCAAGQFVSPTHLAEISWVPVDSVTIAYAVLPASVPEPTTVAPSRKLTVPVGGTVTLPATCAKSVTRWPKTAVVVLAVSVNVSVGPDDELTTCVYAEDDDGKLFASPL